MSFFSIQQKCQETNTRSSVCDVHCRPDGVSLQESDNSSPAKIRRIYASSLDSMKTAHLNGFYHMNKAAADSTEGTPLTRSFSYFNPCPLRLTVIELCKKPLNAEELPEIFSGLEDEFISLHNEYQKQPSKVRNQLLEEVLEGDFSERFEFNRLLASFVSKININSDESKSPSLISVFQNDVNEAKELLDFLTWSIKLEMKKPSKRDESQLLSADILLMRALSSIVKTGKMPPKQPKILNSFFSKLNTIKVCYDALGASSKFSLDHELQYGSLGTNFEAKAENIFKEIKKIVAHVQSNNRSIVPLLVFLAQKQAKGIL